MARCTWYNICTVKPTYAVTCIKKSPFSCPVLENCIWIEPLLRGHLCKATFSWSQWWPLNTGLTVITFVSDLWQVCCLSVTCDRSVVCQWLVTGLLFVSDLWQVCCLSVTCDRSVVCQWLVTGLLFVSDLWQVCCFLGLLLFPPPIKLTAMI